MKQSAAVNLAASDILLPFDPGFDPSRYSKGKSHFQLAFCSIRDPERKQAISDFYAFCRLADDLADENALPVDERKKGLLCLKQWARGEHRTEHEFWRRLEAQLQRYEVPAELLVGILEGVELDMRENIRFENWGELNFYVQGVACDVGEVVLHIIGAKSPHLKAYARDLGRCVQYLNIMRDLEEDWRDGRLYVPKEALGDKQVLEKNSIPRLRELLFSKAMTYRSQAKPYSKKCFPAEMMVNLYIEIAKRYWRKGFPTPKSKCSKLCFLVGSFYRSWLSLRKLST